MIMQQKLEEFLKLENSNPSTNEKSFRTIMKDIYDLLKVANAFPQHANALLLIAIRYQNTYIQNNFYLIKILKAYSNNTEHMDTLFTLAMNNPDQYIQNHFELGEILKSFSYNREHMDTLFTLAMNNLDQYIQDKCHLMKMLEAFSYNKKYMDILFNLAINKSDKYIQDNVFLMKTLKAFSHNTEYMGTLFTLAINNPKKYIQNNFDLGEILKSFSYNIEYMDTLFTLAMNNPDQYIQNHFELSEILKSFSYNREYMDTLFTLAINNPDQYIQDKCHLMKMLEAFSYNKKYMDILFNMAINESDKYIQENVFLVKILKALSHNTEHMDTLFTLAMNNPDQYIQSNLDLCGILKACSNNTEHTNSLFRLAMNNLDKYIQSNLDLCRILKACSNNTEHTETLFSLAMNNSDKYIQNNFDLGEIIKAFPKHTKELTKLLTHQSIPPLRREAQVLKKSENTVVLNNERILGVSSQKANNAYFFNTSKISNNGCKDLIDLESVEIISAEKSTATESIFLELLIFFNDLSLLKEAAERYSHDFAQFLKTNKFKRTITLIKNPDILLFLVNRDVELSVGTLEEAAVIASIKNDIITATELLKKLPMEKRNKVKEKFDPYARSAIDSSECKEKKPNIYGKGITQIQYCIYQQCIKNIILANLLRGQFSLLPQDIDFNQLKQLQNSDDYTPIHPSLYSFDKRLRRIKESSENTCNLFSIGLMRHWIAQKSNSFDKNSFGCYRLDSYIGISTSSNSPLYKPYFKKFLDERLAHWKNTNHIFIDPLDNSIFTIKAKVDNEEIALTRYKKEMGEYVWEHTEACYLPKILSHCQKLLDSITKFEIAPGELKSSPDLIKMIGRFHWWFSHAVPYLRGSAAIAEVIAMALFEKHGFSVKWITLPDCEALISPSIDDYAERYHEFFIIMPLPLKLNKGIVEQANQPSLANDTLVKTAEGCFALLMQEFSTQKKAFNFFNLFGNLFANSSRYHSLEDILVEADKQDSWVFKTLRKFNWIDEKGGLTQNTPMPIGNAFKQIKINRGLK